MKKQGHVNVIRHLIGDRKPIIKFLGIGTVATLVGCDTVDNNYYAFTKMGTCESTLPVGQCNKAYKQAEKEAQRTALKYMVESECSRDFGTNVCIENNGIWSPRMAGFITHKQTNNTISQPFFTTLNPSLSLFGKAFMADGNPIADLKNIDGLAVDLGDYYSQGLPSSQLERLNSVDSSKATSGSNGGSLANSLLGAYILNEVIDEAGDYLSEKEKTKRYKECLKANRSDCERYRISSGTARIGKTGSTNTYRKPSQLEQKVQKQSYKQKPKVSTKAKGGFGSSGRSFGGFGS